MTIVNMKRIFAALLLFTALGAKAQNPDIVKNPQWLLKWLKVNDSVRAKIYFQGTNDTLATQAYVRGFISGGLSLMQGYGIKISGDTVAIDSLNYRKMDSMYVVTDSTFIIKINGRPYSFKMRGAVFSFNGRIGAVVPQRGDYRAFSPLLDSSYNDPSFINTLSWAKLITTPNSLAGYGILDGVFNLGGGNALGSGSYSSRPAVGSIGRFYYATDSGWYYDNGTAWVKTIGSNPGTITGTLTPGQIAYAQNASKISTAPIVNDTTNSRIRFDVSILVNNTGASTLNVGTTAQRPGTATAGMLRYNTDSSAYEFYNGVSWQKFGTGSGGGGGGGGTVTLIAFGRGLNGGTVTTTGAVSVDTTFVPRFADTVNHTLVTGTYLATRNYLTTETDPVANAKNITVSQVASGGVLVANSGPQTLGSSPSWTIKLDSTVAATVTMVNKRAFAGGTAGNLGYVTAAGNVYTVPIVYDSANNQFKVQKTLLFDGSINNPLQYTISNTTSNMILVAGTKTNGALGSWVESVTDASGLYHINQNGSTAAGAWLSDQWISGGRNDITHFDVWSTSGPYFMQGLRNFNGTARYDFGVGALPLNVPYDFTKESTDIMQFDSLGRIYYMTSPRTGGGGDSLMVRVTATGEVKMIAQSAIAGTLSRVAPIDSLARVANGIQVTTTSIVPQTADNLASGGSNPGFITASFNKLLDSIRQRLPVYTINLQHPGVGIWSGYSSPAGDKLYFKNHQVASGLLLATQTDSSELWSPDFTVLANLTGTQTFSNKTLTSPTINSPTISSATFSGLSPSSDTTTFKPMGVDASGHPQKMVSWLGSGGGNQSLSQVLSASADTIKITNGSGITIPAATHSLAGVMTAGIQSRVDSIINVTWYGHGHKPVYVPYTVDSLIFPGFDVVAASGSGLGITYIGTRDSLAWRISLTALTTNGDLLMYNNGVTRLGKGADGQMLITQSGIPTWVNQPSLGGGTVDTVTVTNPSNPVFSVSVTANPSVNPNIAFTTTAAPANSILGAIAAGAPSYFNPSLTSSLFANEGTTVSLLHGNASGNPSWGPVNMATDVTGTMLANQMPALTGAIFNTAGSLNTQYTDLSITNAKIANSTIDVTTKLTGILQAANGGTGVNNAGKLLTLGGNFTTSGAFPLNFTLSAATSLTLPTSGTLLPTNGVGSGLSGITWAVTGTANQVLVNGTTGTAQTGNITLSTPQSIGTSSSPTFTGLNLTGLPAGATTDNIVVQNPSGGVIRSIPQASFLNSAPPAVVTAANTTNAVNATAKARYTIVDSVVTMTVNGNWDCSTANSFSQITVTLPVTCNAYTSGVEGANYIGAGTWYSAGTSDFVPVQARLASATTMVLYCKPTQTISTQYSVIVQYHM